MEPVVSQFQALIGTGPWHRDARGGRGCRRLPVGASWPAKPTNSPEGISGKHVLNCTPRDWIPSFLALTLASGGFVRRLEPARVVSNVPGCLPPHGSPDRAGSGSVPTSRPMSLRGLPDGPGYNRLAQDGTRRSPVAGATWLVVDLQPVGPVSRSLHADGRWREERASRRVRITDRLARAQSGPGRSPDAIPLASPDGRIASRFPTSGLRSLRSVHRQSNVGRKGSRRQPSGLTESIRRPHGSCLAAMTEVKKGFIKPLPGIYLLPRHDMVPPGFADVPGCMARSDGPQ